MHKLIRVLVQIVAMPFPFALRRHFLNCLPGIRIESGAKVGLAIVLAEKLEMAPGSVIDHFTLISSLGLVRLGRNAAIGRGNKIVGVQRTDLYSDEPNRLSALILEDEAAITRDHVIDCSATVSIGAYSIIAGWGTQILSHSPDFGRSRQVTADVHIGRYTFVGTGSIILKGARLPDRSILAAGSVLQRAYDEEFTIYAGNPAKPVSHLSREMAYFRRPHGRMAVPWTSDGIGYGNQLPRQEAGL